MRRCSEGAARRTQSKSSLQGPRDEIASLRLLRGAGARWWIACRCYRPSRTAMRCRASRHARPAGRLCPFFHVFVHNTDPLLSFFFFSRYHVRLLLPFLQAKLTTRTFTAGQMIIVRRHTFTRASQVTCQHSDLHCFSPLRLCVCVCVFAFVCVC